MCGLILLDSFFRTQIVGIVFLLVLIEHKFIANLFSVEIPKEPSFMLFSFPFNGTVMTATIIFDYLFVALAVYILLTILTKSNFHDQKL
jgi:hypothetical protein